MKWKWDSHVSCDTERKSRNADQNVCSPEPRARPILKIAFVVLLVVALGFDLDSFIKVFKAVLDLF